MTDFELEQCIAEYGADIYSFCCCLTGYRQEADDLYQEIFLRAVEKKSMLDTAGNVKKSYLLSVAVRLWRNQRRKAAWRNYNDEGGVGSLKMTVLTLNEDGTVTAAVYIPKEKG